MHEALAAGMRAPVLEDKRHTPKWLYFVPQHRVVRAPCSHHDARDELLPNRLNLGVRGERPDSFHVSNRADPRASSPRTQTREKPRSRDSVEDGLQRIHELIDVEDTLFTDSMLRAVRRQRKKCVRFRLKIARHEELINACAFFGDLVMGDSSGNRRAECKGAGFATLILLCVLLNAGRRLRCPREAFTSTGDVRCAPARSRPYGRYGWHMEGSQPHETRSIAVNAVVPSW